jgi:hypothetical protein
MLKLKGTFFKLFIVNTPESIKQGMGISPFNPTQITLNTVP